MGRSTVQGQWKEKDVSTGMHKKGNVCTWTCLLLITEDFNKGIREKVTPGTVLGKFCAQNRGRLKMGEQREVLSLNHKHACVCMCV